MSNLISFVIGGLFLGGVMLLAAFEPLFLGYAILGVVFVLVSIYVGNAIRDNFFN
jgi:hypothetical protein